MLPAQAMRSFPQTLVAEAVHELLELRRIAERGAVAEADELRLEGGQPASRLAIARRIWGESRFRLVQARDPRVLVHVGQHVAEDQGLVGLAPEGAGAGRVAGDVEDLEAGDLVALTDRLVDLVAGSVEDPPEEVRHELVRLALVDHLRVLGSRDVGLGAPE